MGLSVCAIQSMYVYIPALLLVASMLTMRLYKLDEEYPCIKAELDERRAKAAAEEATGLQVAMEKG